MKKSLLASIWAITASILTPKSGRERQKQNYSVLPKTKTEMPVANTPPETKAQAKKRRERKAKRGY